VKKAVAIFLGGVLFMGCAACFDSVTFDYTREKADYAGWTLWVWNASDAGQGFELAPSSVSGGAATFVLQTEKLGLAGKKIGVLPKYGNWQSKDGPDRFYTPDMGAGVVIAQGQPGLLYPGLKEFSAKLVHAEFSDM
jgi:hypothetical protein